MAHHWVCPRVHCLPTEFIKRLRPRSDINCDRSFHEWLEDRCLLWGEGNRNEGIMPWATGGVCVERRSASCEVPVWWAIRSSKWNSPSPVPQLWSRGWDRNSLRTTGFCTMPQNGWAPGSQSRGYGDYDIDLLEIHGVKVPLKVRSPIVAAASRTNYM